MSDLPVGWIIQRLDDAGGLLSRRVNAYPGFRPYLATSDINQGGVTPSAEFTYSLRPARADLLLDTNDVLQAKMKGTDKAFLVREMQSTWLASTGFAQFAPENVGNCSRFFLHFLASRRFLEEKDARCVGSTQQAISDKELAGIVIALPPRVEQNRIADVLDAIDCAIRGTEAIIAKLNAVKQCLVHDLLTRGVDANGDLRGLRAEAPHLYKESLQGWIPIGWGDAPVRRFCSVITKGTTPAPAKMSQGGEGVRFLRVDNLTFDGCLDLQASNFFVSAKTHRSELARSICIPGDVLMNIVGPPLGKVGLITHDMGEVNINQAIALFRPTSLILPEFLLLWVTSPFAQKWFRQRAKQTSGQVNLTLALCQELPIADVPLEEQRRIVLRVASLDERISQEVFLLSKLRETRHGLMDDLLTGRVRVTPLLEGATP